MKRIMLTALEFGESYNTNRAICELVMAGRLSAVGCNVTGEYWAKEFYQLRDVVAWADQETKVGLTICLSAPAIPLSNYYGRFPKKLGEHISPRPFPPLWQQRLRAFFTALPITAIEGEIARQIDCFEEYYARPPQFLALEHNLARFAPLQKALVKAAGLMKGRQPALVGPREAPNAESAMARQTRKQGLQFHYAGPKLPLFSSSEDLRSFFWNQLANLRDCEMVFCSPSYPNETAPKSRLFFKGQSAFTTSRAQHLNFLNSEEFPFMLNEKDLFLF
ncbi:ChbG/HpnK family deacetylase [Polycladidibacter hongkongensis]|uniref:ChbG/HpnK family deacetylase n=1 Tax=Polycladidibacter hongkongensis TaxID=1647556 RepID=UPI0008366237|nr:ChbG/HpnK family deacetylase [Pseudovibrio hongkongensis]